MTSRTRIFFALLACLTSAVAIQAKVAAPPQIPQRLTQADCVVVGKVVSLEDKTVMLAATRDDAEKQEYRVALVKIDDGLFGAKGLTHVRVAFRPVAARGGRTRFEHLNHTVGQEACFILTRHFAEPGLFVAPAWYQVLDKSGKGMGDYDAELKLLRRCTKILEEPDAALKSKDAADRFLAAALLIGRYRNADLGTKTEPIPAEQSKLILAALAEADWTQRDAQTQLTPHQVFAQLALQPADGWKPPIFKDVLKEFPIAAQKWLKDNPNYRIQRYVADAKK